MHLRLGLLDQVIGLSSGRLTHHRVVLDVHDHVKFALLNCFEATDGSICNILPGACHNFFVSARSHKLFEAIYCIILEESFPELRGGQLYTLVLYDDIPVSNGLLLRHQSLQMFLARVVINWNGLTWHSLLDRFALLNERVILLDQIA